MMTDHIQIHVQKEGSINETNWSDRTLTIDEATETVTVSRRNHPSDLYHHSMRVLGIQKWPHVNKCQTGHGHDPAEAKMTLHMMGVKVPAVKFGGEDAKSNTSTGTGTHTPGTGSTTPGERPSPSNNPGGVVGEVDSSWMVRCLTQEDYHAAVTLLERIVHARQQRDPDNHSNNHQRDTEEMKKLPLPTDVYVPGAVPTAQRTTVL